MPLNVYLNERDIPSDFSYIYNNDALFENDWLNRRIKPSRKVLQVMQAIDGATTVDGAEMQDRFGNKCVSLLHLSTGAKTLINIINHPDYVISLIECGTNALRYAMHLEKGTIYLPYVIPVSKMEPAVNPSITIILHKNNQAIEINSLFVLNDYIMGRRE